MNVICTFPIHLNKFAPIYTYTYLYTIFNTYVCVALKYT